MIISRKKEEKYGMMRSFFLYMNTLLADVYVDEPVERVFLGYMSCLLQPYNFLLYIAYVFGVRLNVKSIDFTLSDTPKTYVYWNIAVGAEHRILLFLLENTSLHCQCYICILQVALDDLWSICFSAI